jgi:hypothetical protein
MEFLRESVNLEAERRLVIHLITSTEFCKKISAKIDLRYIKSGYLRKVTEWVLHYYGEFKECPSRHIQDLYEDKKPTLMGTEAEMISALLTDLSTEYETLATVNVPYLVETTLEYFRKRNLEIFNAEIEELTTLGQLDAAELKAREYRQIEKNISNWVDPFDPVEILSTFEQEEEQFFQYQGALGKLIGNLERDWLLGIFGSMKKGKSWLLSETAIIASFARLKVVYISLEMNKQKILYRLYKRLCAFSEADAEVLVPLFDCLNNQNNSCSKKERTCGVAAPLFSVTQDKDFETIRIAETMGYKPCSFCRGSHDFSAGVWYKIVQKKGPSIGRVQRNLKGLVNMYGRNIQAIAYPAFSATLAQIENDIYSLEVSKNFIPDVLVIDYADILRPDVALIGREATDFIWKRLKGIASSKHCLVVTASQLNRGSINKKNVGGVDIAEDIRKLAHIDVGIFMNQTPFEKRKQQMRLSHYHRHKEFDEFHQAMALQALSVGQPVLDSEVVYIDVSSIEE